MSACPSAAVLCGRFEHRGNLFDNLRNIRHYLSTRQERKTRGDVAQLGEHHVRNVGAEGSNPFISTMGTQAGRKQFRPVFLLPPSEAKRPTGQDAHPLVRPCFSIALLSESRLLAGFSSLCTHFRTRDDLNGAVFVNREGSLVILSLSAARCDKSFLLC